MNSSISKPALRQQLRERRDAFVSTLSDEDRQRLEAAAAARLLNLLGPGIWASYVAMGTEISPADLAALAPATQPIAYPWFASRTGQMQFRLAGSAGLADGNGFVRGPFGIRQPDAASAQVTPDWIVMPLVGCDARGNRIGQGAGHYDRALAALRPTRKIITIGLAWDVQLLDTLPADPWDQPLDFIITPGRTIAART